MENVMFKERKKSTKKGGKGGNILIQLVLIGISMFLLFNIGKSIQIALQKVAILETARGEVDELRIENISHLLRKDTLESDDYIETAARDRLNYSKDGEIVFIVPEVVLSNASEIVGYILDDEFTTEDTPTTLETWKSFFVEGV